MGDHEHGMQSKGEVSGNCLADILYRQCCCCWAEEREFIAGWPSKQSEFSTKASKRQVLLLGEGEVLKRNGDQFTSCALTSPRKQFGWLSIKAEIYVMNSLTWFIKNLLHWLMTKIKRMHFNIHSARWWYNKNLHSQLMFMSVGNRPLVVELITVWWWTYLLAQYLNDLSTSK